MELVRRTLLASVTALLLLSAGNALAQPMPNAKERAAAAANDIADFFSKVGDQIYADCIFELSPEQIEVQHALINAYIEQGASSAVARRLAVKQIQPPKLSAECEEIRKKPRAFSAPDLAALEPPPEKPAWETTLAVPPKPKQAKREAKREEPVEPMPPPQAALKGRKILPRWDCAPNVDYVTVHINGFARKLTDGEICNPYEDVVHAVPDLLSNFHLGYTISTGRLYVLAKGSPFDGRTIAWAISGRDVCRNNPDPDCLAARSVGSLPPGEYTFSSDKDHRVTWGPKTKRNVVAIYLRKLWNQDRFTRQQKAAILKRGNIAIHVRLKGEMSEACLGLEPKGWSYVASLVKEGRATGVHVYLDEPYPQVAEAPPLVVASSFSLTSLFK